jgi:hypothetical protein
MGTPVLAESSNTAENEFYTRPLRMHFTLESGHSGPRMSKVGTDHGWRGPDQLQTITQSIDQYRYNLQMGNE